jgi:hypothetical protein
MVYGCKEGIGCGILVDDESRFERNEGESSGGGLQFLGYKMSAADIARVKFENNSAPYGPQYAAYA